MIFTGDENEKDFLEKCLGEWDQVVESGIDDILKLIKLGALFHEMRHRLDELQ
jgi:hypothetical protein